jgi:hypothetical protein
MVRIMRPIRKGRDLPLPTTIFFNEDHPPQTATCRLLPLGDLRSRRLGEPVLLPKKERPGLDDVRRWHRAPSEKLKFGDREGEAVIEVAPEQEQSVHISHHALNKLHPKSKNSFFARLRSGCRAHKRNPPPARDA